MNLSTITSTSKHLFDRFSQWFVVLGLTGASAGAADIRRSELQSVLSDAKRELPAHTASWVELPMEFAYDCFAFTTTLGYQVGHASPLPAPVWNIALLFGLVGLVLARFRRVFSGGSS